MDCWVAAGDVDIRRQSFTARRATPAYFHLPFADEVPKKTIPDLLADIREGLEEVFDRPNCRAPFIPGYTNKGDAIARAEMLGGLGREGSGIILVRLRGCLPKIRYRRLEKIAEDVSYQGTVLNLLIDKVLIICEPFTKGNVMEWLRVLG